MNDFQKLQDNILNALSPDSANSTGWRSCHCPVCKRTERKTAGVMVDHDTIAFQCFRASCDSNCVHENGQPLSKKFKALCKELGVSIPASVSMVKSSFQKKLDSLDETLYKKHIYKHMKIPDGWVELDKAKSSYWHQYYSNRRIDTDNVLFITKGIYKNKTAIKLHYYDKLIGFQIVDPEGHVKYRTYTDNDHILAINGTLDNPVLLVEGVLDALCFPNACGIMRSNVTPEQAYALRGKDVIMLPDRSGNDFVKQAKSYGWKVCIPTWDDNDLNAAVHRYGLMVVSKMIADNLYTNYTKAQVAYEQWKR